MRDLIRRRPLVAYYALALAIGLAVMAAAAVWFVLDPKASGAMGELYPWGQSRNLYPNILTILQFTAEKQPIGLLILIFAAAPSLSALAISAITAGGPGVAALLDRLRPWPKPEQRAKALRTYGLILGVYLAGFALYFTLIDNFSDTPKIAQILGQFGGSPLIIAFWVLIAPLIDEGGGLEELGWRGFALPRMLDTGRSPLVISVILGLLWTAWHLPREIPGLLGGADLGAFLSGQASFAVLCVALSIIATWLVNRTGGSALPGILVHGGTNVWSKALGDANKVIGVDLRTWIVIGLAILVVLIAGPALGRSKPASNA